MERDDVELPDDIEEARAKVETESRAVSESFAHGHMSIGNAAARRLQILVEKGAERWGAGWDRTP